MNSKEASAIWRLLGACEAAGHTEWQSYRELISIMGEPTDFTVVLEQEGSNKIQAIKAVRTFTGMGLKEAKDLVEATKPVKIHTNPVSKETSYALMQALQQCGCVAYVRAE